MAKEGVAVRERPWGRVLMSKRRGMLLRLDCIKDGWGRLEADFTEEGQLETVNDLEDDSQVYEGYAAAGRYVDLCPRPAFALPTPACVPMQPCAPAIREWLMRCRWVLHDGRDLGIHAHTYVHARKHTQVGAPRWSGPRHAAAAAATRKREGAPGGRNRGG